MTIIPMIAGAITLAFIELVAQHNTVASRLSDSVDAQVVATNYVTDVESASQLTTDPSISQGCGPVNQTELLGLEWNAFSTGSGSQQYETVVSYDLVPDGVGVSGQTIYTLVRNYCNTGSSATPTTTTTVSSDVSSSLQAAILPSSITGASTGWISVQGITGVTFAITEPSTSPGATPYSYSLTADPSAAQQNTLSSLNANPPSQNCEFANPTTGTYARNLCFLDFSSINFKNSDIANANNHCQPVTEGITGTPYTISFCFSWIDLGSGSSSLVSYPFPTWVSLPYGESFLGTNGFYTLPIGNAAPALYQSIEGSKTEIFFTNVSVTDSTGQPATGWTLVTGDAESTDNQESITWSTCPSLTPAPPLPAIHSSPPWYSITGGGACTGAPDLFLLNNSPTSPFGNACADPAVTSPSQTTPPSYGAGVYLTGVGTTTVECDDTLLFSEKTGTVMLEASSPSTLSVFLNGDGLQGMFVGVLLP